MVFSRLKSCPFCRSSVKKVPGFLSEPSTVECVKCNRNPLYIHPSNWNAYVAIQGVRHQGLLKRFIREGEFLIAYLKKEFEGEISEHSAEQWLVHVLPAMKNFQETSIKLVKETTE